MPKWYPSSVARRAVDDQRRLADHAVEVQRRAVDIRADRLHHKTDEADHFAGLQRHQQTRLVGTPMLLKNKRRLVRGSRLQAG